MDESVLPERGVGPGADSRSAAATLPAPAAAPAVPAPAPAPAPVPSPAAGTPGRAGPSRWSALPYAIVLAAVAGGLAWMGLTGKMLGGQTLDGLTRGSHIQAGMVTVAVAVLLAAMARLVLPERKAGLLVCRHRLTDVLVLAILGAGLMATALVLPSPA